MNDSPAYQLLKHVWNTNGAAFPSQSWETTNHAMAASLRLAITAGLRFDREDFCHFEHDPRDGGFRSWRWLGDAETFYALACTCGHYRTTPHMSACHAFEYWRNRKPFLLARTRNGTKNRLYVGAKFLWKSRRVQVTSFSEDGLYLTACAYPHDNPHGGRRQPGKRYKITLTDLREWNRLQREG